MDAVLEEVVQSPAVALGRHAHTDRDDVRRRRLVLDLVGLGRLSDDLGQFGVFFACPLSSWRRALHQQERGRRADPVLPLDRDAVELEPAV